MEDYSPKSVKLKVLIFFAVKIYSEKVLLH